MCHSSAMVSKRVLLGGAVLALMFGATGCASQQSTAPAPSPTAVTGSPVGGEAEAFCQQVQTFVDDMKALATEDPNSMKGNEISSQARELADKATKLSSDLSRDPDELQKIQDCLQQLGDVPAS